MRKLSALLLFTASAAMAPMVHAADTAGSGDDLAGVELDVMDSGDSTAKVSTRIALPANASDMARERSARGLQTANDARQGGADYGRSVAEQSRDTASDRGRDAAASARGGRP